ncbi:MAG: prolyl oligopeptidase family serine peptidase, partial [Acidobacteria bacterium]|nr:prolyl oligopeptidase family serine peptidase [Acidobacteriota bacterium]
WLAQEDKLASVRSKVASTRQLLFDSSTHRNVVQYANIVGVPVLLVHGDRDTNVPPSQTDDYAAAARGAGDFVEVQPVEGGDHFVLIDPDSRAWADVIERLPLLLVTGLLLPPGGLAGP